MNYKKISIREVPDNLVKLIADRWLLVTCGDREEYNMMTASWGAFGEMWGRDIATIVIRPTRYTYEFLEKNDRFSLNIFSAAEGKNVHAVCGSKSGRDTDKTAETGLTPRFTENGILFEQAKLVVFCKKLYTHDLDPSHFLDPAIDKWYQGDYHRVYVGEITEVLIRE